MEVAKWTGDVTALRCTNVDFRKTSRPAFEVSLLALARCGTLGAVRAAALSGLAHMFADSPTSLELGLEALKDLDQQVREAALAVLPRLTGDDAECRSEGRTAALHGCLSCLRDSIWSIRVAALKVLPELASKGHPAALTGVARCLEDPQWVVHTGAVSALCRVVAPGKGELAVQAAAERLEHTDKRVRWAAGDALVQLATTNGECVAHAVELACSRGDARIRRSALQVLDQIAESAAGSREVRSSLTKLALKYLDDSTGSVREAAVRALGNLATSEVAALFVAVAPRLIDGDPHVRKAAELAMQSATAELDADLLLELLFCETPAVQQAAQELLKGKASGKTRPTLKIHLTNLAAGPTRR
jgi:HEAT repeat protein